MARATQSSTLIEVRPPPPFFPPTGPPCPWGLVLCHTHKLTPRPTAVAVCTHTQQTEIQTSHSPFFLLALDLPAPPVFQSVIEKNIIPQVPIAHVLAKYDGVSFQEARGLIRRYKATRLPPYVVLHFRRFTKNAFVEERNPTIVNFPITGLNMRDCELAFPSRQGGAYGREGAPTFADCLSLVCAPPWHTQTWTTNRWLRWAPCTISSPTSRTKRRRARCVRPRSSAPRCTRAPTARRSARRRSARAQSGRQRRGESERRRISRRRSGS
jgi:hypothetical protein